MRFQLIGPKPKTDPVEAIQAERRYGPSDLARIKTDAMVAIARVDWALADARARADLRTQADWATVPIEHFSAGRILSVR